MKRVILFSFFIMTASLLTSCTADALPSDASTTIHADDTGGQNGTVPPPPKPHP